MEAFPQLSDELLARYGVAGPRYTSYPTAPVWSEAFDGEAYADKLDEAGRAGDDQPLSLYFHLPFCREMCAFCGCNVVITRDARKVERYLSGLAQEMDLACARLGSRRRVTQLHWGGGTPTFLDEAQLARLWREVAHRFVIDAEAEVAVEIDPVVTTPAQLTLLRSLGFNRLSMGVQDFTPEVQHAAKRVQSLEETRRLIEHARTLGFSGINLDLIYGLPLQTADSWRRTIEAILDLRPDRAAVYSFAYVPDVRPHQRKLAALAMPRGRDKLALFAIAHDAFTQVGYRAIGMDHFALPSDELARAQERRQLRRNFQGYTVIPADDVIAFGITAISDVQGAYAQNTRSLVDYARTVENGRLATVRGCRLTSEDRERRRIIQSLMCNAWVDLGAAAASAFAGELDQLRALQDEGLLELVGSEITLTALGRVLVRNVAMVFDTYLRKPGARPVFSQTI